MSRPKLQRRLRELEQRPRPSSTQQRTTWDLEVFTVAELERMRPLAVTYEAAGGAVEWTPAEVAVFEQLARVYRARCRSSA